MPRLPINYSNTIIYKLCCLNPEIKDEYVGHTTDFPNRKRGHKSGCNNPNNKSYNLKVYQFIRENGDFGNWSMIMLEEFSCENKLQAEQRERYWIETLKPNLNTGIPTRTPQEYYLDNKEIILEQIKQYNLENKEKIAENQKHYRLNNKEILSEKNKQYRLDNKEQIAEQRKQYYLNNKEQIAEQKKQYRLDNKEQISEQRKQQYLKKKLEKQGL